MLMLEFCVPLPCAVKNDGAVVQALGSRHQVILDNILDNDEADVNNKNGMVNTELQFEMATRDRIIHNQHEAQRNMWNLLMGLGLDEKQISIYNEAKKRNKFGRVNPFELNEFRRVNSV